jgi:hypothetical protein
MRAHARGAAASSVPHGRACCRRRPYVEAGQHRQRRLP